MTKTSDVRLLVVGLIGLALLGLLVANQIPTVPLRPASVRNDERDGVMVLHRWLDESGYEVRELVSDSIQPGELDAIFIFEPDTYYTPEEAQRVQRWVQQGHTLIVAGTSSYFLGSVLAPYDITVSYLQLYDTQVALTAPTLIQPPVASLHLKSISYLRFTRTDVVIHIALEGSPVLISFPEGRGTVWVMSSVYPFTNLGLQEDGSPQLVMNLLQTVPRDGKIGFDEALHGQEPQPESLTLWFLTTVPGLGIFSAFVLVLVFLVLRGRRFGQPMPLPDARLRREPVEFIRAIAHLLRRSGQREYTLQHYRTQFGRWLSSRYGVDLRRADLAQLVAQHDPTVDAGELQALLDAISPTQQITEQELVSIVKRMDDWIRNHS